MSVDAIADTWLERVCGGVDGPNRTTVTTREKTESTARTDYGQCLDTLQRNCTAANTGLFGTDRAAAGRCVVQNMPTACPPTLSGGQ